MVLFGITLVMLSGFFVSSFLAIVGVTLLFWGAILYYVKPTKQVPFSFVAATSNSSTDNINKFLSAINVVQKGYYLPPKSLHDTNSSLVFIPRHTVHSIPTSELTDNLFASKNDGVLLTPPGYDFSRIMEQRFGQSFSKVDLQILRIQIPKLLVEELEISENVDIQINNDSVIFEIQGNIFINECEQAQKYPLVHETVGCILSSSLACVLAKVTGKAVIIKNEKIVEKTTTIEYQIIEE
jgi:hypothetical protein